MNDEEKTLCCGCTACYSVCPKKAIEMISDEEGFEYPFIIEDNCIRCYQCISVCPISGWFFEFIDVYNGGKKRKICRCVYTSMVCLISNMRTMCFWGHS